MEHFNSTLFHKSGPANKKHYLSINHPYLVVIAPASRAGDPGSNPGPGENFFLLNY